MATITFSEIYTGMIGKNKALICDVQANFNLYTHEHNTIAGKLVQEINSKSQLWRFEPHGVDVPSLHKRKDLDVLKREVQRSAVRICKAEAQHIEIGEHFAREQEQQSINKFFEDHGPSL